jgi:hypothetical protein
VFGSASAPPFGLRSSRTEHPQHQRPRGWAKTNRRSGPSQVAKLSRLAIQYQESFAGLRLPLNYAIKWVAVGRLGATMPT